jgi:hypothetical protein
MYPLNDKDLDRLSRDAAEHYDVESSTSGWERLENRLDKELPVKKDRRRFLFWLFFIVLLTGGSLVYMLGREPAEGNQLRAGKKTEDGKVGKVGKVDISSVPADDKTMAAKDNADNDKATSDIKVAETMEDTVSKNEQPATKAAPEKSVATKRDPLKESRDAIANDPTIRQLILGNLKRNSDRLHKDELPVGYQLSRPVGEKDNQNITDQLKITIPSLAEIGLASADVSKTEDALNKKSPLLTSAEKPEEPAKKQTPPFSRWEFGVQTGPDFNNVKFKHSSKTGINLGAYIGYRFSNRWLVSTGLIYTKKFYKVEGEDFTPPKPSWLSYQDIKMVEGSCNMFEIPLNVRYDFSFNQQRRWFASTGVSSYIMDKQDYVCDYVNQQGELNSYPWKEGKNYNYFISNINLSVGYERILGKHFSLQAEPYFKIPVQGLGYGSIKMNSYGLLLGLKYKL